MEDFLDGVNIDFNSPLGIAILVVAVLICIVGVIALVISIVLAIRYRKYNKTENSVGLTGEETARKILDLNGLEHIKVKTVGSLIFGNSYSHYFKKVRLRRRTKGKTSVAALAMGAQKSALAVLDKEGDPDMKKRVRLVPLITFGPFMCVTLILVAAVPYERRDLYRTGSLWRPLLSVFSVFIAFHSEDGEEGAKTCL